jgi:hypothetical protein
MMAEMETKELIVTGNLRVTFKATQQWGENIFHFLILRRGDKYKTTNSTFLIGQKEIETSPFSG